MSDLPQRTNTIVYDKLVEQSKELTKDTNASKVTTILKRSAYLNNIEQEDIINIISANTSHKKKNLNLTLDGFNKEGKSIDKKKNINDDDNSNIEFKKTRGYYFLSSFSDSGKQEIMVFNNDLKYIEYNMFNPKNRKFVTEKYIKVYREGELLRFRLHRDRNSDLILILLKHFATTNQYRKFTSKIYLNPLYDWFENDFENESKQNNFYHQKDGTWCFGTYIINNKIKTIFKNNNCDFVLPDKYDLTSETEVKTMLLEEKNISKAEYNEDDIKRFLTIIKNVPKTEEGMKKWYNTLAFSLSTPFKTILSDCGVQLFPEILLLGKHSVGKTQIYMQFLVQAMWGSLESCNSDTITGTTSKLVDKLTGTLRPQVFDEVTSVSDRVQNLLKESATVDDGIGAEISRKTIGNKSRWGILTRPIFMSANNFRINDDAMRDRIYTIPFKDNSREDNNEISQDNMAFLKMLMQTNPGFITKQIYNIYETLSVDDIKKIIKNNVSKHPKDNRLADKQTYLDVGLMIIEKLYEKFNIELLNLNSIKLYDQKSEDMVVNTEKTGIESIFNEILSTAYITTEIKEGKFTKDKRYTILDFIKKFKYMCEIAQTENEYLSTEQSDLITDIIDKFFNQGIGFIYDDNKKNITDIVLFDGFRKQINRKNNIESISTLSKLSDNLNCVNIKSIFNGPGNNVYVISGYKMKIKRKQKQNNIIISLKDNDLFETFNDGDEIKEAKK